MLSIYSNQRESRLPPCRNYFCLNQSIFSSFSFSRVIGLYYYCVFSPNPCNIIGSQSTDNFASSCMQTRSHIHCTPLLPFPFFLCHTHKFRPAPPPPPPPPHPTPNPNKSIVFSMSLTPSHSLPLIHDSETIVKQLKHSGSIKSHILFMGGGGGGGRLQKSYWQKAMNETERMAESVQSTQQNRCNWCAQIVG